MALPKNRAFGFNRSMNETLWNRPGRATGAGHGGDTDPATVTKVGSSAMLRIFQKHRVA